MKNLKAFIISALFAAIYPQLSHACLVETPERWYMFKCGDESFRTKYDNAIDDFWYDYCGIDPEKDYVDDEKRMDAAKRKGDRNMQAYLTQLEKYDKANNRYDDWDYPTSDQIKEAKSALLSVINKCAQHHSGPLAERWTLLEMRANLALKNYDANIRLWENVASKMPKSPYREYMRNIYANALLNTGKRLEAWNIYAEQRDKESILWSARKFINLEGLQKIYEEAPNTPIFEYLLERYVNYCQEIIDVVVTDKGNREYVYFDWDDGYAKISPDFKREMARFEQFALKVANEGKNDNPALFLTAAALVDYYNGKYTDAINLIDRAMTANGSSEAKDLTRRVRMLIYPEVANINSPEFKQFITGELTWLEKEIERTGDRYLNNALDRIINLGLSRRYAAIGDYNMAIALQGMRDVNSTYVFWVNDEEVDTGDDHNSTAFRMIYALDPDDMVAYFEFTKNPGNDPLARHALKFCDYSPDYVNDLIGTRFLKAGEYSRALPYLSKVSLDYLSKQAISPYALARDYHIPAWSRFQPSGSEEGMVYPTPLKRNIKVDYCNDMIAIEKEYPMASIERQKELDLNKATYLYQASPYGQCWFLTDYSNTAYPPENFYSSLAEEARQRLDNASTSADPEVKANALFGLAGTDKESWAETEWEYNDQGELVTIYKPVTYANQYLAYGNLDRALAGMDNVPEDISRCDVLKQFRKHK